MIQSPTLEDAIQLAAKAHAGQLDKGNNPYILHPLRVMLALDDLPSRITGILHDVIEDTPYTLEDLSALGYPESILQALDCLSRRKEESYEEFILRIKENPLACKVKLADLRDNSDMSRIPNPTEKDRLRHAKYQRSIDTLLAL
jgi:(p)ppGpp synthase/HD superfamily hydrolase